VYTTSFARAESKMRIADYIVTGDIISFTATSTCVYISDHSGWRRWSGSEARIALELIFSVSLMY